MFTTRSSRVRYTVKISAIVCIFLITGSMASAASPIFTNPITFSSGHTGILDLLMVARSERITGLANNPTGWVYDICLRPKNGRNKCLSQPGVTNLYGGARLKLQKGDTLKIRLVNQLPLITDSKHASEPGHTYLALNPTNIHTHGMFVSPHRPSKKDPTYGDNIFVLTFNSANGKVKPDSHIHTDVRYDFTDYSIKIPKSHPSGLFWFHPHAHGISGNQLSAGMSGIITVGEVQDYVTIPDSPNPTTNYMLIKDAQILADGTLQDQTDPDFCAPNSSSGDKPRRGFCAGQDNSSTGGENYAGGNWFFTINGQQYPIVPVANQSIFSITNGSASRSYNLKLWDKTHSCKMLFQILSTDGIAVHVPSESIPKKSDHNKDKGSKFTPLPCPEDLFPAHKGAPPMCTDTLLMMPSSRTEILVTYRDCTISGKNKLQPAPADAFAIFKTSSYNTGPIGDFWPSVDLAKVTFTGKGKPALVHSQPKMMENPAKIAHDLLKENKAVGSDPKCHSLPPGHMRRIYFAAPTTNLDAFGLAYEEIDKDGNIVGPPATDVAQFDPQKPSICLPLGPENTPTKERWQLVNLTLEDHNFHLHQVKFHLLRLDDISGEYVPYSKRLMIDNVPLAHASGTCGNNPPDDNSNPISDFHNGLCKPKIVTVEVPFAVAGDFVYHCHILEHEDGGMMARISVKSTS